MVWQPNILSNCYELSGGYAPPEPPTGGSAPGLRWETSVPQTPCAPHLQILATPLILVTLTGGEFPSPALPPLPSIPSPLEVGPCLPLPLEVGNPIAARESGGAHNPLLSAH